MSVYKCAVDDPNPQRPRPPLPPSITAPFDALTVPNAPAETASTHSRRPLLELFPEDTSQSRGFPARADGRASQRSADGPAPPLAAHDAFYGLIEPAFSPSTDPRFFYHSTPHDLAGQQLLTAIRRREGLVLLTGVAGAGKTTLCRTVIEELDRRTVTSLITDRLASPEDLLRRVLADFGVLSPDEPASGTATERELSTTLHAFVESLGPLEASAVIMVDNAHDLTPEVLTEVRALCEAADASSSLLQVVLVGRPALLELIHRSDNRALDQRVVVRSRLDPLPPGEIEDYVLHRLAVAGGSSPDFDERAIAPDERAAARIFELSHGVPGIVNLICDRALAWGYEASAPAMTADLVDAAARDLNLGPASHRGRRVLGLTRRLAVVVVLAACVIAGAVVAAFLFRDAVGRILTRWQVTAPLAPR
ncbi:MAG TPA: AAA family ATPase [Vicinamibacterales bacterium]|jgi:general secretion pathway protein A|nr:AAA family ATPase [Vicinamibacterales bacterium]